MDTCVTRYGKTNLFGIFYFPPTLQAPSVCLPFTTYFRPDINTMSADDVTLVKLRGLCDLSSFTHVATDRTCNLHVTCSDRFN